MADNGGDMNPPVLNLTPDEKRVYSQLFQQADTDRLGVVTGEVAVKFFEKTKLAPNVLGEIWQIADQENRGLLTKAGFCMALRLIAHYQAGRDPSLDLAFKPGPLPRFDGMNIQASSPSAANAPSNPLQPPSALQPQTSGIRIPPLLPEKAAQYSSLFERSGAQSGVLSGESAKAIFERAGLPNEILGRIWGLADREQKGALDHTEFTIAMHLITSFKSRSMTALPSALPPGLYEAAARKGQPAPRQAPSGIPRQFTGPQRTSSPLARPPGYGTPPPQSAQTTGQNWLVTSQEKTKYDQFFDNIDTAKTGFLDGEQAVKFFNDSGLSEDALASIWDLADIRSEGRLNREEFAVAMYLIRQQRSGAPLPAFLPAALVPPSMRGQPQQAQQQQQQPQSATAQTFDGSTNNTPQAPKSAADDLFGLDSSPAKPPPIQTSQTTGGSVPGRSPFDNDPFNDRAAPFTPQFTGPNQTQQSSMFKPFQPTSAFGASIASQHTGGSVSSPQQQNRGFQPPQQLQSQSQSQSANDDLLGDNDDEESKKLTEETTELANMSTQIGNLRNQMQDVQTKRTTNERDVANTNSQKQELQQRLAQFRAQYEQEVQKVKSLEQQLNTSRAETRKLQQDIAMIEGTHQDLQTQHAQIAQALEADRTENATLKSRISELNTAISQLRPQIEKMKSEARQQKGMVAINKKQLATNESERDRLNNEMSDLTKAQEAVKAQENEQARSAAASPNPSSNVVSPAASVRTNPFFRKASQSQPAVPEGVQSPTANFLATAPSPSAFDALFGPPASRSASQSVTPQPPSTSFHNTEPESSFEEEPRPTSPDRSALSASPGPIPRSLSPAGGEPPPPPESRQFTPRMLPVHTGGSFAGSTTSSTKAVPSVSGMDGIRTPRPEPAGESSRAFDSSPFNENFTGTTVAPSQNTESQRPPFVGQASALSLANEIPGAFPDDATPQKQPTPTPGNAAAAPSHADFDAAFADFGKPAGHNDGNADVFGPRGATQKKNEDFYPMTEPADESDSSDDDEPGFADNFNHPTAHGNGVADREEQHAATESSAHPVPPTIETSAEPPPADQQKSPPAYSPRENSKPNFPDEFEGLLPSRDDPTASPHPHSRPSVSLHQQTPSGGSSLFPGSTTSDMFQDASSRPMSTWDDAAQSTTQPHIANAPQNSTVAPSAFPDDDFADFNDLSEAKASSGEDKFDFHDNQSEAEFNPNFDSPAASMMTTGVPGSSSHATPIASTHNGFHDFSASTQSNPSFNHSSAFGNSTATNHDWDAIFSGLDNTATAPPTTLSGPGGMESDNGAATPKATSPITATAGTGAGSPKLARALSAGSEHDDPILKRLTGMGYERSTALNALEKYDYDINKAVDFLTSQ
ncbi:hypothetical protein K461DRAFT_291803 [Myriangium duriaei CBS 260.36]|uniref:Cytoskeletal adapter protein sagA n=1 Tax=Myriangium duriaei CBS 260.36 TaxID=1168546 RepID=A0A9P4J4Z2_9PEZI|nr:hypothetical protein K461DRAFT_291803 [Myriangium duriaei CBS 260.36]